MLTWVFVILYKNNNNAEALGNISKSESQNQPRARHEKRLILTLHYSESSSSGDVLDWCKVLSRENEVACKATDGKLSRVRHTKHSMLAYLKISNN